jgi:hypothetical protein
MSQHDNKIKTIQIPNEVLLPFLIEELKAGHTATLPLRGRSMRPFLEDGRDKALLKLADDPKVGDAVLAEIQPGHFVLHRIIRIDGEKVTLRGDGNLSEEHCHLCNVRAKAIGFYRKGRTRLDSTDSRKWRIYSWWWTRLYPIRRYLLFMFHPHIPQRFK